MHAAISSLIVSIARSVLNSMSLASRQNASSGYEKLNVLYTSFSSLNMEKLLTNARSTG